MCFVAFVWWESHAAHPLVDLSLFRNGILPPPTRATLLLYAAFGGFGFLFSYFLQTTANYSTTATGAAFLPGLRHAGAAVGPVGEYAVAPGPRWLMSLGPLFCAAGMLPLMSLGPQTAYVSGVLPGVLLFGAGLVLTVAPLTATALNSAPDEKSGTASAINNGRPQPGRSSSLPCWGSAGLQMPIFSACGSASFWLTLAALVSFTFVRKAAA